MQNPLLWISVPFTCSQEAFCTAHPGRCVARHVEVIYITSYWAAVKMTMVKWEINSLLWCQWVSTVVCVHQDPVFFWEHQWHTVDSCLAFYLRLTHRFPDTKRNCGVFPVEGQQIFSNPRCISKWSIVAFRSTVLGEILGSSRAISNICNVHGGGVGQHTCHLFTTADCLTPLICR